MATYRHFRIQIRPAISDLSRVDHNLFTMWFEISNDKWTKSRKSNLNDSIHLEMSWMQLCQMMKLIKIKYKHKKACLCLLNFFLNKPFRVSQKLKGKISKTKIKKKLQRARLT